MVMVKYHRGLRGGSVYENVDARGCGFCMRWKVAKVWYSKIRVSSTLLWI